METRSCLTVVSHSLIVIAVGVLIYTGAVVNDVCSRWTIGIRRRRRVSVVYVRYYVVVGRVVVVAVGLVGPLRRIQAPARECIQIIIN